MKAGRARRAVILSCAVAGWSGLVSGVGAKAAEPAGASPADGSLGAAAFNAVGPNYSPTINFTPTIYPATAPAVAPPQAAEKPKKKSAASIADSAIKNFDTVQPDAGKIADGNRVLSSGEDGTFAASEAQRLVPDPYVVVSPVELPGIALANGPGYEMRMAGEARPSDEIAPLAMVPVPPELKLANMIRWPATGGIEVASTGSHSDTKRMAEYWLSSESSPEPSPVEDVMVAADSDGQELPMTDPAVPLDGSEPVALIATTMTARVLAWQSVFHGTPDGAPPGTGPKKRKLRRAAVLSSGMDEASAKAAVHASLSLSMPDFRHRVHAPISSAQTSSVAHYVVDRLTEAYEAIDYTDADPRDPNVNLAAARRSAEEAGDQQSSQAPIILSLAQPITVEDQSLVASVDWFIEMTNQAANAEATDGPGEPGGADAYASVQDTSAALKAGVSAGTPVQIDSQTFGGGGGGSGGNASVAYTSVASNGAYSVSPAMAMATGVMFTQYSAPSHHAHGSSLAAGSASSALAASSSGVSFAYPMIAHASVGTVSPGLSLPPGIVGYKVIDKNPGGVYNSSQAIGVLGTETWGFAQSGTNFSHAAFWGSTASTFTDLHPSSSYSDSNISGISGSNQLVGFATTTSQHDHAIVWIYNTSTKVYVATDLNPTADVSSVALATTGTHQVGYGYTNASFGSHALIWSTSASSAIDLNPAGFNASEALGAFGNNEVGYGQFNNTNGAQLHAMLWAGTSSAATDIQPSSSLGFLDSRAVSISGNGSVTEIGGYGTSASGFQHALVWKNLTAGSAADLNPSTYVDSQVTATAVAANGTEMEVGFGRLSTDYNDGNFDIYHALLWLGSAGSFTDLNQYLPGNFTSAQAVGIDATGDVVGWALNGNTGNYEAVEWLAQVPEPSSLALIGAGACLLGARRRRRQSSDASDSAEES